MSTTWYGLSLQQTSSPPLLFQYTWTRQGYALCVTDLTSIWTEKLSHKEILTRAEENSTTIDPSEDQEQFDVLLAKIAEALRGDGGSATLNSGSQDDSLELSTSSKLPAPLRPLKWTIYLSKESSSSLTDHLLLPLLKDEAGWESRQRVLLDQLKQKDWALGKLLDKFESLGVDLGTVFPGAAGMRTTKKGSTRSDAGKFIKGLASFDESAWLRESGSSSENSGLAANILHELGGSRGDVAKLRAPQDKWWDGLPKRPETASSQSDKNITTPKEDSTSQNEPIKASQQDRDLDLDQDGNSTASDDDEFQRQETPPRIKAQRERLAASAAPSNPKEHQNQPSNQVPDMHPGEATASDSEPEADTAPRKRTPTPTKASPPKPETKESPKKPTKARGRLGAIGGKKKTEEKEPSPTPPSPSPPPAPSPVPTRKPKGGKLGMIGGKAKNKAPEASSMPAATATSERKQERSDEPPDLDNPAEVVADPGPKEEKPQISASRDKESADPVPEETEEQRTARKREELKRQLEEKSKAPKKKRRF